MLSPLPRNKRAKLPKEGENRPEGSTLPKAPSPAGEQGARVVIKRPLAAAGAGQAQKQQNSGFSNNPFAEIDVNAGQ